MLALALWILQAAPAAPPTAEIRFEFFSPSTVSADLELEISATAIPKAAEGKPAPTQPTRVTRFLTWHAGGTDLHELAILAAGALGSAGLDTATEGQTLIVRGAVEASLRTTGWEALGAQISVRAPADAAKAVLGLGLQATGAAGDGNLIVSADDAGTGPAAPSPLETADVASRKPTAKPKPGKKPAKVTAIPLRIESGAATAAMRSSFLEKAKESGWAAAEAKDGHVDVTGVGSEKAPAWIAVRYTGKGDVRLAVRVAAPAAR